MMSLSEVRILPAADGRDVALGPLRGVVARGEGFPQLPPLPRPAFEDVWARPGRDALIYWRQVP
ncbi:MAG: hypothetical protein ACRDZX_06030 [Acidimicrobiales bacterium]